MIEQQPTSSDGDASPLDRIEAFLAAEDGPDGTTAEGTPPEATAATPDKPGSGASEKSDEPQFTTSHMAQYLGLDEDAIDVDADGSPVFKTNIDGKVETRKFSDLLETYQKTGHADNRMREVAAKEAAAERKMQEAEQAIGQRHQMAMQRLQDVEGLANVVAQTYQQDRAKVNWNELWATNPSQAGQLRDYYDQRDAQLVQVMQGIQQRRAQSFQQVQAAQATNAEKAKGAQQTRMLELIPQWKDPATYSKETGDISNWVRQTGFDISDFDLNKATHVNALRQLWQHSTLQQSKPDIEKKLRDAPKLVKPGNTAPKNAQEADAAKLKALKQQARTTGRGSQKATEAYLLARGIA